MPRICKYCGSEMDLMESYPGYQFYVCTNEQCNAKLQVTEDNYQIKEEWNTDED